MKYVSIDSINECGEEEVWDISLLGDGDFFQDEPNFIAQNIVVHNSHAAGMATSPIPLATICPLHKTGTGDNQTIATQFTGPDVERMGLIKIDILGVKTKTVIHWTQKAIKENYGDEIDWDTINLHDKGTLDLLRSGKTDGCFQLEEHGMQDALREIGIDSFDDVVVTIAMHRPGPMDYIPEFARRKKNAHLVQYLHPIIKRYTENTYAIIVYQEQAMQIFVELAGLTNFEGYIFIKGSAKKDPKLFQSMKQRFIEGASRISNKSTALEVWRQMEPFQGYSFNRGHATSYAVEAYKTAYLKAHYPSEFIAARLSVETLDRKFDKVNKYMRDAVTNFGFSFVPPDLNESKLHWTVVGDRKLRQPMLIKGIGPKVAEAIVANQPYEGKDLLYAFTKKVGSSVNTKSMQMMIELGLWDSLEMELKQILINFEQIKKDLKKGGSDKDIFG